MCSVRISERKKTGHRGLLAAAGISFSRLNEPTDPEYVEMRARIDAMVSRFDEALSCAVAVENAWSAVAQGQAAFSAVGSCTRDRKAPGAQRSEGAFASKAFRRAVARSCDRNEVISHLSAYEEVNRLRAHLRGIQERYSDVSKAKTQYETFARRVRRMESKNQTPRVAASLEENRQKEELARKMYFSMRDRIMERMRAALAKTDLALCLLQNAFWIQQASFHRAMSETERPLLESSRATEPLLVSTNIIEDLSDPGTMFTALPLRQRQITAQLNNHSIDSKSSPSGDAECRLSSTPTM